MRRGLLATAAVLLHACSVIPIEEFLASGMASCNFLEMEVMWLVQRTNVYSSKLRFQNFELQSISGSGR